MDCGGSAGLRQAHQAEVDGGEENGHPGEKVVGVSVLENGAERKGGEGCVGDGEEDLGDQGAVVLGVLLPVDRWNDECDEEENDEDGGDGYWLLGARDARPLDIRGDEEGNGRGKSPKQQAWPWLESN